LRNQDDILSLGPNYWLKYLVSRYEPCCQRKISHFLYLWHEAFTKYIQQEAVTHLYKCANFIALKKMCKKTVLKDFWLLISLVSMIFKRIY